MEGSAVSPDSVFHRIPVCFLLRRRISLSCQGLRMNLVLTDGWRPGCTDGGRRSCCCCAADCPHPGRKPPHHGDDPPAPGRDQGEGTGAFPAPREDSCFGCGTSCGLEERSGKDVSPAPPFFRMTLTIKSL